MEKNYIEGIGCNDFPSMLNTIRVKICEPFKTARAETFKVQAFLLNVTTVAKDVATAMVLLLYDQQRPQYKDNVNHRSVIKWETETETMTS